MAAPPVASVLAEASAAVVSGLTAGVAAASTPRSAMARRAAGVDVAHEWGGGVLSTASLAVSPRVGAGDSRSLMDISVLSF
jgi:hypothetical protein